METVKVHLIGLRDKPNVEAAELDHNGNVVVGDPGDNPTATFIALGGGGPTPITLHVAEFVQSKAAGQDWTLLEWPADAGLTLGDEGSDVDGEVYTFPGDPPNTGTLVLAALLTPPGGTTQKGLLTVPVTLTGQQGAAA